MEKLSLVSSVISIKYNIVDTDNVFLCHPHRLCLKLKMSRMRVLQLGPKQNKLLNWRNLMKEFL